MFFVALKEVPKSGEVWCEGARLFLNPHSECFSLDIARQFLEFAIEFTPQYGDSFIELMRLQMLLGSPAEEAERLWQLCINAEPNYGTLWFHCKVSVLLTTRQVLHNASKLLNKEVNEWRHVYDAARVRGATPEFKAASEALVAAAAQEPAQPDPRATLPPLEISGPAAEAADFVTGCVNLNRMHRGIERLDVRSKRALIYGGDLIVP